MTTSSFIVRVALVTVVEAYRLDRYDNFVERTFDNVNCVVEAYRLDRYDNFLLTAVRRLEHVVEAYRLDRYDNMLFLFHPFELSSCRSLSFG